MGVSVEDATQLRRVDDLRETPAKVRFLSAEPLLGPLFPPEASLDPGGFSRVRVSDSDATDPTPVRRNTAEHHVLLALELQRAGCRGVGGAAGSCDSGYCRSRGTGPGELADVGHGGLADAGVRELGAGVRTAQASRRQFACSACTWHGGGARSSR